MAAREPSALHFAAARRASKPPVRPKCPWATSIPQISQIVRPLSAGWTSAPRIWSRPGLTNRRNGQTPDSGSGAAASRLPVTISSTRTLPSRIAAIRDPSGERTKVDGARGYATVLSKGPASGCRRSSR
jgi:hypothetical protein